jgi:hypothetical protein
MIKIFLATKNYTKSAWIFCFYIKKMDMSVTQLSSNQPKGYFSYTYNRTKQILSNSRLIVHFIEKY